MVEKLHLFYLLCSKILSMIKFAFTILYVDDVVKTINFYEQAFEFSKKFITPDNSYGEVTSGETTLSFASNTLALSNLKDGFIQSHLNEKPFGIEIGFTTDDVQGVIKQAIEAGATLYASPKEKPWGQIVGYVRDLDGFLIEICTPID
ncbi:MAG: VOC family protein [Candidatus Methylopumilus sp.]